MIDFTQLKEGQTILFDFEGKTYERKVQVDGDGDCLVDVSNILNFNHKYYGYSVTYQKYVFWLVEPWSIIIQECNVRLKPEPPESDNTPLVSDNTPNPSDPLTFLENTNDRAYNFYIGQKVSYVIDGEICVGNVINSVTRHHDLIIETGNDYESVIIWLYNDNLQEWCGDQIEEYQVKPIIETDMEKSMELKPSNLYEDTVAAMCNDAIIAAKLEFADKMLAEPRPRNVNTYLIPLGFLRDKINQLEEQKKIAKLQTCWDTLRGLVIDGKEKESDAYFYNMLTELKWYYETQLKDKDETK